MAARDSAFQRGIAAAILALGLGLAGGARADVIDGDWCQGLRHFSIKGPEIVTPAGTRLSGDYSRHFFTYVVPASEPQAGQLVAMTLVNENTVHLRIGADAAQAAEAPPQVWRRCAATISLRPGVAPRRG